MRRWWSYLRWLMVPAAGAAGLAVNEACTPAEIQSVVADVQAGASLAHDLCTIMGKTDLECITSALSARKKAALRLVSDAGPVDGDAGLPGDGGGE